MLDFAELVSARGTLERYGDVSTGRGRHPPWSLWRSGDLDLGQRVS